MPHIHDCEKKALGFPCVLGHFPLGFPFGKHKIHHDHKEGLCVREAMPNGIEFSIIEFLRASLSGPLSHFRSKQCGLRCV